MYEREADRVADQVLSQPTAPSAREVRPRIQRYSANATETIDVPPSVNRVLGSPGRPLEPGVREDMERRFGHDFSRVMVHSDTPAAQSAAGVNANAYTVGRDIVFGTGQFAPGTREGRRLLAHELTHVVQQGGASGGQLLQRERTQEEEGQRDKDRGDRRSTDSRRDRQALGLADPFDNFDSDWAGRMILGQYLYGGGREIDVRDDPAWTEYMTKSKLLRGQVWLRVVTAAADLAQQGKPGRWPTLTRFHADLENGEGIIGYQYLHGTNEKAGDFFIVGFGEVAQFHGPHSDVVVKQSPFLRPELTQRGAGTRVDFELSFIWNDIIDPNSSYVSDRIKSALAEFITLGKAEAYQLSIGWRSSCSVWLPASGGREVTGGYPAI